MRVTLEIDSEKIKQRAREKGLALRARYNQYFGEITQKVIALSQRIWARAKAFWLTLDRRTQSIASMAVMFFLGIVVSHIHFNNSGDRLEDVVKALGDNAIEVKDEVMKNLKLSKVQMGEFPEELAVMGKISVSEDSMAMVSSRVAGRIVAVSVRSGEMVQPGQMLVTVNSPDYVVAREEYLQTKDEAVNDPEAKTLLKLSRQKLISLGMSNADIDRLNAQTARTDFADLIVRAPSAGAVLDKKAIVGNLVNPGDPLVSLGDVNKVWFTGDVYPEDLSRVKIGEDIEIQPDNSKETIHGTVSFVSPVLDSTTRTVKIRAKMENPQGHLPVDMYLKASLIVSKKTALIMPKQALLRLGNGAFVFKVQSKNTFKKVPIETLAERADVVAISQGLTPGDEVVVEGALLLDAALASSEDSLPNAKSLK